MIGQEGAADDASSDAPRPRRHHVSVRVRVLSSVLAMSALGLMASGAVANAIQTQRTLERVDGALTQEIEEFRTLAAEGVDPETGQRFSSVDQLLLVALQRNVPSENEMFLTFRSDQPDRYSAGGLPELLSDAAVLDAVRRVPSPSERVVRDEVDASVGAVRLAIVPVGIEGSDEAGKFVVAFAVDRELAQQADLMRTYAVVSLLALLLIGAVGWLVAGRLLRPLRTLREATQRIGETDLTRRVDVTGSDDLSELGQTFNAMLDRLEGAFATQRQFIDDAGHELKTPLTVLRGHLELVDPADPVDVAETRALLLDEIDRMGRLVEDLILLAKADRADFVRPTLVELGPFTDEVVDKARALGDRRWTVDHRAEASVVADQQRLTQAVLQLADNAVKFTQAGTTVAIGTRVRDSEARIWVRDEGPGIPPEDRARIFDRFARARTGEQVEGSGLGLAIVRAIAEAHQGTVEVSDAPGGGTTITIVVPTKADDEVPRAARPPLSRSGTTGEDR